jgi:DNA invertase Pin-like site-specific DNA recombinase
MRGDRPDGRSINGQVTALRKHGAGKVFREVASRAKTHCAQLRRVIDQLEAGDVLMVTRLDRLARPVERPCRHRRPESRLPLAHRDMGRHHHIAGAPNPVVIPVAL